MKQIKAGIIGVSGYTGLELVKLLSHHPAFTLCYLANTQGAPSLSALHPLLESTPYATLPIYAASPREAAKSCELLFLALPHKQAMGFVREILSLNPRIKIIDLSADYRLSAAHYEAHYCAHEDAENLAHAVYGLPEYNAKAIESARLVANPGCYPTASLLALLPFARYIDENEVVYIDAKSGVSGAGKGLTENTHYPHINENLFSYSPLTHRHQIEIAEKCLSLGKSALDIAFVPHLLPLTRGMLVSVFARLKEGLDSKAVGEILNAQYKNAPFVRLRSVPCSIAQVAGTHFCDIYAALHNERTLFLSSAIDNLLRGAASQAVANANLMCGLEAYLGITAMPHGLF